MYHAVKDGRRRAGLLIGRTAYLVGVGFGRERLRLRAAGLTYMTLLALVPALAVVFSVFTAFEGLADAQGQLKSLIVEFLAVTHREAVNDYLSRFIGSVHTLGGVSMVILFVTTVSLLSNIERSFNDIWGIKEGRGVVQRFEAYWPLLTLAPVLFGVSLTLTASLETSTAYRALYEQLPGAWVLSHLGSLVLTWAGYAILYLVMPNTRVPVRFAMLGGVVAGTMWEVAKYLFTLYTARAVTYSAIYGSLAIVPLTIIWIYVSWLIALIGGLLTFASQNARTFEPQSDAVRRLSETDRERMAALLLLQVYRSFERCQGPSRTADLLAVVPGPPRAKRELLGELAQSGMLIEVDHGEAWAAALPAHRATLGALVSALRRADERVVALDDLEGRARRACEALSDANTATFERLDRVSMAQILASPQTEDQPTPAGEPAGIET